MRQYCRLRTISLRADRVKIYLTLGVIGSVKDSFVENCVSEVSMTKGVVHG